MKHAAWVVCALFVVFGCSAWAATVELNSSATDPTNQFNNIGVNVAITPNGLWNPNGAGIWISYANSGEGGTDIVPSVPGFVNGQTLTRAEATATFTMDFVVPNKYNSGSITVWADDTAGVYLDGNLLIAPDSNIGTACADAPVSCGPTNGAVLSLDGITQGAHELQFDAYQLWGFTYGLQYEGSIDSAASPEPATFVLIGGALLGLGWWRRKALVR